MWINDNTVTADFLWFLEAWNLDFINSHFMESSHGLIWRGNLRNIPTIIIVNVPKQPGPYKTWGEPHGHCHGHIRWPVTGQGQHYNGTSTSYNNILSKYQDSIPQSIHTHMMHDTKMHCHLVDCTVFQYLNPNHINPRIWAHYLDTIQG